MKLEFSIDMERCLKEIKDFDRIRKVYCNNPYYFFQHFKNLRNKSSKEIMAFFRNNKEEIEKELIKRKEVIENNWEEINDIFFSEVERITENSWKYKRYKCHVCSVYAGRYKMYKNEITVFAFFGKADCLAAIAEEFVHLHFWEIMRKLGAKVEKEYWKDFKSNFYWQLSECIPCLIFSYSDVKLKLKFGKYPDWREVRRLFKKVKPLWDERKGFEDFLRNALKLKD